MSAVLFSSVTFDQGLYTYAYGVVNDSTSTVTHVDLLVGNTLLGTYLGIQPLVPSYTAPAGWTLYGAFSGSIAGPPYNESGGFYEFYSGFNPNTDIQPGSTAFGFSITTPFAPTLDNGLNDFFLYGSEGVIAFGNTVVPNGADWLIQQPPPPYIHGVPEPATWMLLLIGFIMLRSFIYAKISLSHYYARVARIAS